MSLFDHFSLEEFPNSAQEHLIETSEDTPIYNCIAWAYGVDNKWFWPDNHPYSYWPPSIPRQENLETFIQLFEEIGYQECGSHEFEVGYEKIAIYCDNITGQPTHAARQLETGKWTSKLGDGIDIEHSIFSLNGGFYGNATRFLKREKPFQNDSLSTKNK